MKTLLKLLVVALAAVAFAACEKSEKELEDLGKQAADEFCDCYKKKSRSDCLDKLKSKYSESDYMDNAFIKAFNNQSTCGVKLEKYTVPSSASLGNELNITEW